MSLPITFTVIYKDGTTAEVSDIRNWQEVDPEDFKLVFMRYLENIWKFGHSDDFLTKNPKFLEISEIEYKGHKFAMDIIGIKRHLDGCKICKHDWYEDTTIQESVVTCVRCRRCRKCGKQKWF